MLEAVVQGKLCVLIPRRSIHRLQKEPLEIEPFELLRFRAGLRKNELQFVAGFDHEFSAGLRADTDPIDTRRRKESPVRFDRDFKAAPVKLIDERLIHLQERLAARADNHAARARRGRRRPGGRNLIRQLRRRRKLPSTGTVGSHEIRIAELADGGGTILLAPRPEIARRKPAEDRGAPGVSALALQRIEDFLDRVQL